MPFSNVSGASAGANLYLAQASEQSAAERLHAARDQRFFYDGRKSFKDFLNSPERDPALSELSSGYSAIAQEAKQWPGGEFRRLADRLTQLAGRFPPGIPVRSAEEREMAEACGIGKYSLCALAATLADPGFSDHLKRSVLLRLQQELDRPDTPTATALGRAVTHGINEFSPEKWQDMQILGMKHLQRWFDAQGRAQGVQDPQALACAVNLLNHFGWSDASTGRQVRAAQCMPVELLTQLFNTMLAAARNKPANAMGSVGAGFFDDIQLTRSPPRHPTVAPARVQDRAPTGLEARRDVPSSPTLRDYTHRLKELLTQAHPDTQALAVIREFEHRFGAARPTGGSVDPAGDLQAFGFKALDHLLTRAEHASGKERDAIVDTILVALADSREPARDLLHACWYQGVSDRGGVEAETNFVKAMREHVETQMMRAVSNKLPDEMPVELIDTLSAELDHLCYRVGLNPLRGSPPPSQGLFPISAKNLEQVVAPMLQLWANATAPSRSHLEQGRQPNQL